MDMINTIIFSKDRPCQLDALLRSMEAHYFAPHRLTVMYNYSNDEYKAGYDIIINKFNYVTFVKEVDFYSDTLRLSLNPEYPLIFWLVDDCIIKNDLWYDKFLDRFINDDTIGVYNLRLTPTVKFMTDFPDDKARPFPVFMKDNVWEWKIAIDGDWSYPMTMDGHMYKTKDMIPYLPRIPKFGPPPSFDCTMWQNPLPKKFMICNDQQKILGIVPNRVQTGCPNRHGDVTTKDMNDRWLAGQQLDLNYLYSLNEECGKYHYIPIYFEERT